MYRNPHYKPKTVWRPSQVYNGNPYTNKSASSYSIEALYTHGCVWLNVLLGLLYEFILELCDPFTYILPSLTLGDQRKEVMLNNMGKTG